MRNFVQNWFRIDTKLMRNVVQKRKTVLQENLLFRGNPYIHVLLNTHCNSVCNVYLSSVMISEVD